MPQFNFNFGPTDPMEGPNHSRPPDPMACDKAVDSKASPIPIVNPGAKEEGGTKEIRVHDEDKTTMDDPAREDSEEAVSATPEPCTC